MRRTSERNEAGAQAGEFWRQRAIDSVVAGEAAKAENQQKGINQQVAADRKANGGKLTAAEKKQVNKEQNAASKNIYHKKHNSKTQPQAQPKP